MKSSFSRHFPIFFCVLLFAVSCKTKQTIVTESVTVKEMSSRQLVDSVKSHLPDFHTMAFRARVNAQTAKENQNFTLNLRARNDSIIWATITGPLGYEVARVLVSKDSVKIIDRPNRQYAERPFSFIEEFIPVSADLDLITKVLVGNFFFKDDRRGRWENKINEKSYMLSFKSETLEAYYWVNAASFTIEQANVIDLVSGRGMLVELDDYREVQGRRIPFERKISFPGENAKINFTLNRMQFDQDQTYPFNISDNFNRVD